MNAKKGAAQRAHVLKRISEASSVSQSPYLSDDLKASILGIQAQGDPEKVRRLIGTVPCIGFVTVDRRRRGGKRSRKCRARMNAYAGDPRARGSIRIHCPKCGEWGDWMVTEAEALKSKRLRKVQAKKAGRK